jgi:transposase
MAKELVSDELWKTIEPLLPDEPPKPKGGRPRVDNRSALAGIIFVLKSGIPWDPASQYQPPGPIAQFPVCQTE